MKQILIIADGKIAKIFIEALLEKYFSNNYYTIISNDAEIASLKFSSSFKFYHFDPLARSRLEPLVTSDLYDVFVIMQDKDEQYEVCSIIRNINKDIPIIMSCESKSQVRQELLDDPNLNTISTSFITARTLISKIPNIPSIARGFGLNKGEIMQINIPFGSAYSYISIGSIQQRGWRIAGIYRKNSFLIARKSMMIQPNDSLLVIGDPMVLNNVYKKVISNTGNFPAPFGIDIYVYIDFATYSQNEIDHIITDSLWLHKKIKNEKLIINILNPSNIEKLIHIKSIQKDGVIINVDYDSKSIYQKIEEDSNNKIGLIVVAPSVFKQNKNRRILYKANAPILKIGKNTRLQELETTLIFCSQNSRHVQNISHSLVDFASQLNCGIKLYEFELDNDYNAKIATYYQNIGRVFNKRITIEHTSNKNPIFWLHRSDEKLIQFIPLEIDLLKRRIFWLLNKNADYLSLNIDKNPQMLIPV